MGFCWVYCFGLYDDCIFHCMYYSLKNGGLEMYPRTYEITFLKNGKVFKNVVVADFYQLARDILKQQFKQKIDILGWIRL
jgi:hypothetical protein